MSDAFVPGYHLRPIVKGVLGEPSKIREELDEFDEAMEQGVVIMAMVELADLYGAMEAVAARHFPQVNFEVLASRYPGLLSHPHMQNALPLRQAVNNLEAALIEADAAKGEGALEALYQALAAQVAHHFHPLFLGMGDLASMAAVTRRAFANGRRA